MCKGELEEAFLGEVILNLKGYNDVFQAYMKRTDVTQRKQHV